MVRDKVTICIHVIVSNTLFYYLVFFRISKCLIMVLGRDGVEKVINFIFEYVMSGFPSVSERKKG